MNTNKLKAYVVSDDESSVIIFATHAATARSKGAAKFGLTFNEVESCRREPAFDQYAPGPVPLSAQINAGWWFECNHCSSKFDADGPNDDDDRENEFSPLEDAKGRAFCSPECSMRHWAEGRLNKAREAAAIEAVATKYPEATNITVSGWRGPEFKLPGINGFMSWVPGDTHVYINQSDVEAFQRLYGKKDAA